MPICPRCGARHNTLAAPCIKDGARFIHDAAWYASRQDPLLGCALNQRFALVAPLGSGNMGTVYDALDLDTGRRAAVKILRPDLTHDPILVRRFRREADAIARMHHPNIVQLYAFGQDLDTHYIAMEFVEGKTLASFVPYANFSRSLTLHLMHQLLVGLAEAHQHQIIHRDLKPDNIFLCAQPDQPYLAKILDFGLAKLAEVGAEQTALTATGEVFGTPLYISPEQATAQAEVTLATDLYTLGVIFYELLSGEPPFNAPSPLATMMQHVHTPPPPLAPRPPLRDLSPALRQLVSACLEKDPSRRYPSAAEALAAFLAAPEGQGLASQPSAASLAAAPLSALAPPAEQARPASAHTRTILYGQSAVRVSPPAGSSPYRPPPPEGNEGSEGDEDDTSPDPLPPVSAELSSQEADLDASDGFDPTDRS